MHRVLEGRRGGAARAASSLAVFTGADETSEAQAAVLPQKPVFQLERSRPDWTAMCISCSRNKMSTVGQKTFDCILWETRVDRAQWQPVSTSEPMLPSRDLLRSITLISLRVCSTVPLTNIEDVRLMDTCSAHRRRYRSILSPHLAMP